MVIVTSMKGMNGRIVIIKYGEVWAARSSKQSRVEAKIERLMTG